MTIINYLRYLLLLLPLCSSSQQRSVLNLQDVLASIDSNNLLLQTYEKRAESYKHKAEAATAWMPPMAGLGTWQTPYPGQMIMQPSDRGMLMFRAEQQIPNRAKLSAKKEFILSQGDVERAARAVTINSLKAEAKKQYFAWFAAIKKLEILHQNEKILKTIQKVEEVRYPYNQSQLGSIYRSGAAVANNESLRYLQLAIISKAQGYLKALMNRTDTIDFSIDTSVNMYYVPIVVRDTAILAEKRKDVSLAAERIRSMQLEVAATRMQRKPDFKIQFDHMIPLGQMMPNAFSIMGMVSIPIAPWSSNMYKSDIKAMEYSIQAMELEKTSMLQEAQAMLQGMRSEIIAMQNRISNMERHVLPLLQKTFDAYYIQYQENRLPITTLLDSWEAISMMQLEVWDEKDKLFEMIAAYEKEIFN